MRKQFIREKYSVHYVTEYGGEVVRRKEMYLRKPFIHAQKIYYWCWQRLVGHLVMVVIRFTLYVGCVLKTCGAVLTSSLRGH